MVREARAFTYCFLCGIAFWAIDAAVDYAFFYDNGFLDLLVFNVPLHEISVRTSVLLFSLVAGAIIAIVLRKQRQVEHELIESQRRLSTLISNLPGIAYRCKCDSHWTMISLGDGCLALTGYTADDLVNNHYLSYADIIHPDDQQMVADEIGQALQGGRPFELTYRIKPKTGETKWVWERGEGVSRNGQVEFLEGFITDISDMIHLRDDLSEQVNHNQLIQQSAIDGFCTLDENGRIHSINPSFSLMVGYQDNDLIGSRLSSIHDNANELALRSHFERARERQKDRIITKLKHKKGPDVDVEIVSSSYMFEGKRYIFSVVRDITARIKTEAYLKESEERYRLLFTHMKTGVAYCRMLFSQSGGPTDFLILHANPAFHQGIGQTQSTVIGLKGSELFSSKDDTRETWFLRLGLSALSGVEVCDERFYEQMGRWYSMSSYSPKHNHFVILLDDITGRKSAESKLRQLNQTLNDVINASPLAIAVLDREGRVTTWNPEAERTFGWNASEVIGEPYPLVPVEEEDEFDQYFQRLQNTPYFEHETKRVRKDGVMIDVRVSTAPLLDSDGTAAGIVAVLADISQLKEAEREKERLTEQLQQAQRMEAVGQLAGGVAHDFNNLLMVIQGYSDLASSRLTDDVQTKKELNAINKAAERASTITRQLLAFSRNQVIHSKRLNLNQAVLDVIEMVKHLLPEFIEIQTRLDDDLADIEFDPGQIEQILINLAVNARDAMPNGGRLLIETQNAVLNQGQADRLGCRCGGYSTISVSDNGTGMAPEVQIKIFEPFFTTKDFGKGTGLGLSTVYGIVKQADGAIDVQSEVGHGSVFRLYFPIASKSKPEEFVNPPASVVERGDATILLVEDAKAVRDLTYRVLSEQGYKVFAAGEGKEALEICELLEFPVDLIVSDIIMPNCNGFDVARKIRELFPAAKVLFMTGYSNQGLPYDKYGERAPEVLMKPFSPDELLEAVRRTLYAA